MAYGDTMAYTYEVEVEEENGNAKTEKETLHFTYNANTALIYKRLFDTDFLHDVTKLTSSAVKNISKETIGKINSGELSVKDLESLEIDEVQLAKQAAGIDIDSSILTQIAIAMIATNDSVNGYARRTADEIANALPDISTNIELMLSLIEFITYGLKKKKVASRRF